jgi:AraC-like DNA-binding protein
LDFAAQVPPSVDWLFAQPAFYAEFAPLSQHVGVVDHLYVLSDRAIMTADRRDFASPLTEIAFVFPKGAKNAELRPSVVIAQPRFGHRKKNRAFHGWIVGLRSKALRHPVSARDTPPFTECQTQLSHAIRRGASCVDILAVLDRFAHALTQHGSQPLEEASQLLDDPHARVKRLAAVHGLSTRTLRRRTRTATGLPPKRLLSMERFRRAVYEVPLGAGALSGVAGELGFADQAHLTREFQRHAGLTPGAFQRTWQGGRGQAVRFVQDSASPARLRVAIWAPEQRA